MNERIKKAINVRRIGGLSTKDVNLKEFNKLSERERIQAIHAYSNLFLKKYKKMAAILLNEVSDGFVKCGQSEFRGNTFYSGNNITAELAIKKTCIVTGNIEEVFGYGKSEQIDGIINLERSLKLYVAIVSSYDDNISNVLMARLNGKTYEEMEMEQNLAISTLRQYVCLSKEMLDEKYEEINSLFQVKK